MANSEIRDACRTEPRVPLWLVADRLGISEATMTRRLRKELPEHEKRVFLCIINELKDDAR